MSNDDNQHDSRRTTVGGAQNPPPHDLDAEEGIIGAALVWPADVADLIAGLDPSAFYRPAHADIFEAIRSAQSQGWKPDPVTVADALRRRGTIAALDNVDLAELMIRAPTRSSAARHAAIVQETATLRRLLAAGASIVELAAAAGTDPDAALAAARQYLEGAAQQSAGTTIRKPDLAKLIAAGLVVEEPNFMTRSDGRALLYSGKLHMFQGDPSGGKTFLALWAAVEVLAAGGAVIYFDYEDNEVGIVARALALGADPEAIVERFAYLQVESRFGTAEQATVKATLDELIPDLVVIDGVAEALTRDGLNEDSAGDYVGWIERFPRWVVRQSGAAVVLLDHLKKDAEGKGRWARGTGAKLGSIDGAAYTIKTIRAFSREHAGAVRMTIAKDRPGGVGPIGSIAGIVSFDPHARGEHIDVRLDPDGDRIAISDSWKPTIIMARLSEELAQAGKPLSARVLKSMIHAQSPRLVTEAIARLTLEGYLVEERQGRTKILRLVKPYTGDDDKPPTTPQEKLPIPEPDNIIPGPWTKDPDLEF